MYWKRIPSMSIKVFIFDIESQSIESFAALAALTDDIEFVGATIQYDKIIAAVGAALPDIILLDFSIGQFAEAQCINTLRLKFANTALLIYTNRTDDTLILESFRYGASGYILKTESAVNLLNAIRDIFNGGVVINPKIALKFVGQLDLKNWNPKPKVLTNKELEVLRHLASGLSYAMIAEEMKITYHTVNFHIKSIYRKLEVSSVGEAIAYYFKNLF
jgi:DNA-binding NarL/FixJ family response regulator